MSILSRIRQRFTDNPPEPIDSEHSPLSPTPGPEFDAPGILLLVVDAAGDTATGIRDGAWLHQYIYQTQQLLNERDVPINPYDDWTVTDFTTAGSRTRRFPMSNAVHRDIDLFTTVTDGDEPALLKQQKKKDHEAFKSEKYRGSNDFDHYISKYAGHSDVDVDTIQTAITDTLGEYEDMIQSDYYEELVETNPDRFF